MVKDTIDNSKKLLESVITFRQGRTSIDNSQLPNVERIATYLRNHKEAGVVIKGYASPEGSAEVNERIARQMLTDTNPVLRIVAKRNIHQMQERLDALTKLLDDTFVITPVEHVASDIVEKTTESEVISEPVADVPVEATHVSDIAVPASQILAERIKPATDLQHAISLNDSFCFTRELFAGDATRMNEVVRLCGGASSLDEAMSVFMSTVQPDEENEAAADFIELLKKYFS